MRHVTWEQKHSAITQTFDFCLLFSESVILSLFLSSHLSLGEADVVGEFGLAPDGYVAAVVELLLQLQPLVVGIDDAILVLGARPA